MMGSQIKRTCNRHSPKLTELIYLLANDDTENQDVARHNDHSFLKSYVFTNIPAYIWHTLYG